MRTVILVTVPALALLLGACGDGEGDCYEEVTSRGKTYCIPAPDKGKAICIQDPDPKGLAEVCDGWREDCPDSLIFEVWPVEGEMTGACACVPDDEFAACDGEPWDVEF